jgi:hypothetical protein
MSEIHQYMKTKQHELLKGMNTCAICRIEKVDLKLMKADVVPLFEEGLTPILNVPISPQQTGDYIIRVPYKKGDLVTVVFSQRDIDSILYGGGEQSTRMLGIDDAIIIGGINTYNNPLPEGYEEDLLIAKKDFKSRIVIGKDNNITVETDGNIFLGDGATEGVPLGNQLKQWLDSHTHPYTWTDPGGNGFTSPPSSSSPSPSKKVKTV